MLARLDSIERALFVFEHAHQLAIHVSVGMMAAFAFGELVLDRYFVAFQHLPLCWGENFDTGAFRWTGRRSCGFRAGGLRRGVPFRMVMLCPSKERQCDRQSGCRDQITSCHLESPLLANHFIIV